MKTAAVSLFVALALSSPAFAILRSRFPIKPRAPHSGQVIVIEGDSLKTAQKAPSPKASK